MIDYRAKILEVATAEIGPQSKGSLKVEAYWRDVLPPAWTDAQVHLYAKTKEWCGCFALWCLRRAGLAQDIHWIDGTGFLGPARLVQTRTPSRGDVGYVPHPFQHHFVFDRIDSDGWVHSVDGNQPDVREKRRRQEGLTFYAIETLIVAAPAEPLPEAGFLRGQEFSVPGIQDPPKDEP